MSTCKCQNYITGEDSDDEGPVVDINHMPVSLPNTHLVLNSSDIEETEVAD